MGKASVALSGGQMCDHTAFEGHDERNVILSHGSLVGNATYIGTNRD